jgi:uncharacterized membrane protein YgdD (TMEM256/DUF423 family)
MIVWEETMKNLKNVRNINLLLAGGFLFVGGAIIMTITHSGVTVPRIGGVCALVGMFLLIFSLFRHESDK